eukprot:PhM_4_TR3553/c1_g1_i2/m.67854
MSIANDDGRTTLTEHFREVFALGLHPTASRAATLLTISTCVPPIANSDYSLSTFTTEHVLAFCIDATQVIEVDISGKRNNTDFSCSKAPTCIVHDRNKSRVTRTQWSDSCPPTHFIFTSMASHRALAWIRKWRENTEMERVGVSADMRDTYYVNGRPFFVDVQSKNLVELTLPCAALATIPADFLRLCTRLTYVDMSSLTNVREIGDRFLQDCTTLTCLDLSPLTNVSKIGEFFLSGCSRLAQLDLSRLNVSKIGWFFLAGCTSLSSLDLSSFTKVSMIGGYFISDCSALLSLDLSPLSNVEEIGGYFLSGCRRLTQLDLSPLTNVSKIGWSFLEGCAALPSLDLSPFTKVNAIKGYFLSGCSSLTSLDLSPLSNVSEIGWFFLEGCSGLNSLDLSPLSNAITL